MNQQQIQRSHETAIVNDEKFGRERVELIKRMYCPGATDDEMSIFASICRRTKLAPELKQIYALMTWDGKQKRNVMKIQVSIDGLRLIAERSGKYKGQVGPFWLNQSGEWKDFFLHNEALIAAKVGIIRSDMDEPIWGICHYKSYAQNTPVWAKMPEHMLAKCAEALAIRKGFPYESAGLYTKDEMPEEPEKNVVDSPVRKKIAKPKKEVIPVQKNENFFDEEIPIESCNKATWRELAENKYDAENMTGRQFLTKLAVDKKKNELTRKATIALSEIKDPYEETPF